MIPRTNAFFKAFGAISGFCATLLFSSGVLAQEIDFSGDWRPLYHEDLPERIPGPHLADYSGMPINDAARLRGDSYNACTAISLVSLVRVQLWRCVSITKY